MHLYSDKKYYEVKILIVWIALLIFGCSKTTIKSTVYDYNYKEIDLGVLPVVPGFFVEEKVIENFDKSLVGYLKEKMSFSSVTMLNAFEKCATSKFSVMLKNKETVEFDVPDSLSRTKINQRLLLVINNFTITSKRRDVNVPVGYVPLPFFGGMFISVKVGEVVVKIPCSFDFLLWDSKLSKEIAFGRIKGNLNIFTFERDGFKGEQDDIVIFRRLAKCLILNE